MPDRRLGKKPIPKQDGGPILSLAQAERFRLVLSKIRGSVSKEQVMQITGQTGGPGSVLDRTIWGTIAWPKSDGRPTTDPMHEGIWVHQESTHRTIDGFKRKEVVIPEPRLRAALRVEGTNDDGYYRVHWALPMISGPGGVGKAKKYDLIIYKLRDEAVWGGRTEAITGVIPTFNPGGAWVDPDDGFVVVEEVRITQEILSRPEK